MANSGIKKRKRVPSSSLNERFENFIIKKSDYFFGLIIFFSIIIFYKLFDIRVSLAGDDSSYIMAGFRFLKEGIYPTWHSPLYSIFLALPIAIFGISLPALKITSALFLLFSFYFFYRSFKNRISPILLLLVTFITGINSYIAYYSSFTFSEAFYMFFQSLFIFYSFKLIDYSENKPIHYIWLGLLSLSLYMAKTVGLAGIFSLLLFFVIQKNWKKLLFSFSAFSIAYLLMRFVKKMIWGISGNQFSTQLESLMQKDPYKAALGKEDFTGFLTRIIDNSNLYISKHFFRFLGLRSFDTTTIEPILTLLFYVAIIISLIYAFRKNKYILYSLFYAGAFLGITFVTVQKVWDQDRLIIPVFSYLLLILLWTFVKLSKIAQNNLIKIIPYTFALIVLVLTLKTTSEKIKENKDILEASLNNHIYYGFTPDWENYLKMCTITGENYNDTTLIACRKPGMAFIYGKKLYYGISNVPTIEVDSLLNNDFYYYALPLDDSRVRVFTRNMIAGVFYGQAKNAQFESNKYHFLFKTENKMNENFNNNLVESSVLKETFEPLFLYSPDSLVNQLKQGNVDYIISANLRAVPSRKTNLTISTVKRYMQIINMKYPSAFKKIYEVGEDEKAELFEIVYSNISTN